MPYGTIFSIVRNPEPGRAPGIVEFLQPGTEQVCSGFALYGAATILVLTTGHGVDAFTYDRDRKEFVLTHPQMTIPEHASEFAINSSNERFWAPPVRRFVSECLAGRSGPRGEGARCVKGSRRVSKWTTSRKHATSRRHYGKRST